MSFVSHEEADGTANGTERITKRDIRTVGGTIPKGSKVRIDGKGQRGYSITDVASGYGAVECGFDIFEPIKKE